MRVLAPPVTCASLGRGTRVTNATQKPIASWRVFDANKRPGYHASTAAVAGSFGFSVRGRRDGNPNMAVGSVTTRAASSRDVDPPRGIVGDIDNLPISINAMSFDESSTGETTFVAETKLPTDRGFYRVRGYRHSVDGAPTTEPVAIAYGEIEGRESVAVRVHDACFTSEESISHLPHSASLIAHTRLTFLLFQSGAWVAEVRLQTAAATRDGLRPVQ